MRGRCDDLDGETEALREVVAGLTEDEWRLPTPAEGWDTHETIIHLGMADVAASLAAPVSYTHLTLPTICSV